MNKNTILALVTGDNRSVKLALEVYTIVNRDDNVSKDDLSRHFVPCSSQSLAISTNALVYNSGFEFNSDLNN